MAATFFNNNQILGVRIIPCDALLWHVGDMLIPFDQAFHHQSIKQKKRLTIAYRDNNDYRSLSDGAVVTSYDAVITTDPIPLIIDCEDVSFKATADKQRSGLLYTNKLDYSLPRIRPADFGNQEQQLNLLQSGKAYHLLLQLYSCESAYGIALCPETGAFSATVDEQISATKVSISIKNLTAFQFLT